MTPGTVVEPASSPRPVSSFCAARKRALRARVCISKGPWPVSYLCVGVSGGGPAPLASSRDRPAIAFLRLRQGA